jgi:4-amino-4-deoxy-L-arabinose transferase-like glycosyltransferase
MIAKQPLLKDLPYYLAFTWKTWLFSILIIIGLALRLPCLEKFPAQTQQDELSNIYDGYSISKIGTDRWGMRLPMILRGFGESDYRPPLYSWLVAVSIKSFGYSIFAGRFPSALLAMFSLILLFNVTKEIWGVKFAFIALISLVFSPWHISMSRLALEAAILPSFFIILTLYLFIKAKNKAYKTYQTIILGFVVGLATNSYQSTKLIFFIFACTLFFDILKTRKLKWSFSAAFFISVGIGAFPQLYAAYNYPNYFFSRASATALHPSLSLEYITSIIKNFYLNVNPTFLFFGFGEYNNLTVSRLLPIEIIFFYIGIIALPFQQKLLKWMNPWCILGLATLCILPSALTFDNPHALRTSAVIILYPIFVSSGIIRVTSIVRPINFHPWILISCCLMIFTNLVLEVKCYIQNDKLISAGHQTSLVEVSRKISLYQHKFNNIYLEDLWNQPYIYVLYYCRIEPSAFRSMPKKFTRRKWDHFSQMGKYFFLNQDKIKQAMKAPKKSSLFIARNKEFDMQVIDSVTFENQQLYFTTFPL